MSGEFKSCPYCGKVILADAAICKHCGADLTHSGNSKNSSITVISNNFSGMLAFSYMFQDKKFFQKGLTIFLINFITGIIALSMQSLAQKPDFNIMNFAPILLSLFLSFVLVGYNISCIKSLIHQNCNYTLPFVSYFKNFICGLKLYIAAIIFMAALFIPIALLGTIPVINIVAFVVGIIVFIIFLYRLFSYSWIFSNKPMLMLFFHFGLSGEIIAQDHKRYVKALCFLFLSGIISGIINFCLYMTGIVLYKVLTLGIVVGAVSLVTTYFSFVNLYLIAKSIAPRCIYLL